MKRIITIGLTLSLMLALSACSKAPAPSSSEVTETTTAVTTVEETTAETTPETTTEATTAPISPAINRLTGEATLSKEAEGKRPVAVMVNNKLDSLPQYGISAADVIVEAPVEGGITRLMAVYGDYTKVPRVCSIRSARYYFALIANGMDAAYIHWGSDKTIAKETIERIGITKFDGEYFGAPLFSRDAARVKKGFAREHTGYFEGGNLPRQLEAFGYRTNVRDDLKASPVFSFGEAAAGATPAESATLNFSKAYYSTFTYKDGVYFKQHSGKPHMDSAENTQLSFKNVLILKTDITLRDARNGLMNVSLEEGSGRYLTNGAETPITWSKAGDAAPIVLKNIDGTPLNVNIGKTYIGIIGK